MNNKEEFPEINKAPEPKQEEISKTSELNFILFQLNVKMEKFEEVAITDKSIIKDVLDSTKILLFVDHKNNRVWIWEGKNTTAKMKFISAQRAPYIRDKFGSNYNIISIDDGDETAEFKHLLE
jgi:hypothetical protein